MRLFLLFLIGVAFFLFVPNVQSQNYKCAVDCSTLTPTDECYAPFNVESGCRCFDGLDNDGDGRMDANETSCAGFYGLSFIGIGSDCSVNPSVGSVFDQVDTSIQFKQNISDTNSKIVVGDVDGDGFPDAVVASKLAKSLSVVATTRFQVDGSEVGDIKAQYQLNISDFNHSTIPTDNNDPCKPKNLFFEHEIAIADIDKNGVAEIFTVVSNRGENPESPPICYYIIGFTYDKSGTSITKRLKFLTDSNGKKFTVRIGADRPGPIGITDFNGDGLSEIYVRNRIYDAHTGELLARGSDAWDSEVASGSIAIDIQSNNPGLELVCGRFVYSVSNSNLVRDGNSTTFSTLTINQDMNSLIGPDYFVKLYNDRVEFGNETHSSTAVADLDNDGHLDVLISGALTSTSGQTAIFYWNVSKQFVSTYAVNSEGQTNGWPWGTGPINLSDIDYDGYVNINFTAGNQLHSLTTDATRTQLQPSINWTTPLSINTSRAGILGVTGYDFDNNGALELVYRDSEKLTVLDGRTKSILFETTCKAHPSTELPIIVDADGDGRTDICVPCFSYPTGFNANDGLRKQSWGTIKAISSAGNEWLPTRKVWNQGNYFVVNINDNLTVPYPLFNPNTVFTTSPCHLGGPVADVKPLNMFLNQSPVLGRNGCPIFPTPDITFLIQDAAPYNFDSNGDGILANRPTVEFIRNYCEAKAIKLRFRFFNSGDFPISGTYPVSFFNGDPRLPGTERLHTTSVDLKNFEPADSLTFPANTFLEFETPILATNLYLVLGSEGNNVPIILTGSSITECDISDNIWFISLPGVFDADNIAQTEFTIRWDESPLGLTSYLLDVSTDPQFATLLPGYNKKVIDPSMPNTVVSSLTPGTKYFYRLFRVDNSSTTQVCTDKEQVTIPATPVLNPITTITNNSFTAGWNSVTGATFYEIDVSRNNFASYYPGFKAKRIENLSEPTINAVLNGLSPGTTYAVRIRAGNDGGVSPNSNTQTFSTSGTFLPLEVSVSENSSSEFKGTPTKVKFLVKNAIGTINPFPFYSLLSVSELYDIDFEIDTDTVMILVEEYMLDSEGAEISLNVWDQVGQEAQATTTISNLVLGIKESKTTIGPPYPNPSSQNTFFNIQTLENSSQTNLAIHVSDMLGKTVRLLSNTTSAFLNNTVVWDGLDNNGDPVLPGIYIVKISTGINQIYYRVIRI